MGANIKMVATIFTLTCSKHWQNIRTSPTPCVAALIENSVKLYRILLPTLSNGTWVLIETSNDCHMARTRLSGNTSVRDSPGAIVVNY